ncbi:RagB/SusD family nutrient uptake outer membrane protein [Parabacteroides sp. OttesenSCG-928-G07]|nr:RagB/SusD family nutrient uptake outer membrane protein [Parabacteroides sp. OttesenSCG-928-G21]MDL2277645.1 RagB/SusD family nutrient uptake outer membrane protein [Parabacteroides sp. OttesenSCG-928-G07]
MNTINKYTRTIVATLGALLLLTFSSCLDDLNQVKPNNEDVTDVINEEGAKSFLAKIYAGLGFSGNKGPDGENDLTGSDQGSLVFLRGLITMQEFPSDEAIWNWKDEGIVELVNINWDYTTTYAYSFYQRTMLNIRFCQEYLNIYEPSTGIANIEHYRDEVRALRALNYYYLIDMYGNPGVLWDDSPLEDGSWYPTQIGRAALFQKIVDELVDLSENSTLPAQPSMSTYGRMTKPVVWTLLAKLYLNAEVYAGTPMYDKAREYCEKVINAGFGLEENYKNLFCAENHRSPFSGNEIIYAIPFDATEAKSYGGTMMMVAGASGGALSGNWLGSNDNGWTCIKPKETLVKKFDYSPDGGLDRFKSQTKLDSRYLFFDVLEYEKDGITVPEANWPFDAATGTILYEVKERRKIETKLADWDAGYLCYKFTNLGWDDARVPLSDFSNTDFPLFRLADIYLMYAECAVRGSGDMSKALEYVNAIRTRAFNGDSSIGQVTLGDLTLDFILDERARELYWEGQRRSDLVRFGKFTNNYAWPYKGGVEEGIANINNRYNLYPISDKDLTSNPNLEQNPGYKSLK